MYKSIDIEAQNAVEISGKLLSLETHDGQTEKSGKKENYRSISAIVRANQTFGGKEEVSEVSFSFFSKALKSDGGPNTLYQMYGEYAGRFSPVQRVGADEASCVSLTGGRLRENMYVSKNNPEQVNTSWQIDGRFLNLEANSDADYATFDVEIFILNMDREMDRNGEETGRLKIRGGVIGYNRRIDCFDFFVENKRAVDYIERNFNVNDTAHFVGRIRQTSKVIETIDDSGWGEPIPHKSTHKAHELIITGPGSGCEAGPYDEEKAYNPEDIRILISDRNARREQLKNEAKVRARKKPEAKAPFAEEWE